MDARSFLKRRFAVAGGLLLALMLLWMPAPGPETALGASAAATSRAHSTAQLAAPYLIVVPGTAIPGGTVAVYGANFQPGEVVSISFQSNFVTNVDATSSGTLPTTSITVPLRASTGMHSIYALGLSSNSLAMATLQVQPLDPTIRLDSRAYDPDRTACVSGAGFGGGENVVVQVDGSQVTTGRADGNGTFDLCFTMPKTLVSGDNAVTVVGTETKAVATEQFIGVLPLSHTLYFSGGSTIGGDTTDLPVLNGGDLRARVVVTFFRRHEGTTSHTYTVESHTRATLDLGTYAGQGQSFGIRVDSDKAVVAQMVVHRSTNAPYSVPSTAKLEKTWYFAEGYTGGTFHEFVHILNPQRQDALVQVEAIASGSAKPRTLYYKVPAQRIATLELNRLYPQASISAIVKSDQPVAVTRVMTFGPHAYGANANVGQVKSESKWIFANGSIANGIRTQLAVLNTGKTKATLSVNMYGDNGQPVFLHTESLQPHQRATILLNDIILTPPMTGTIYFDISASSKVPLFLERTMYYGDPDKSRVGSSTINAAKAPATAWTFATGDTTAGTQEYIALVNPNFLPATVSATFVLPDGTTTPYNLTLAPYERTTIDVGSSVVGLPASPHGVKLSSTDYMPIIAEQGIYTPGFKAGYTTSGLSQ